MINWLIFIGFAIPSILIYCACGNVIYETFTDWQRDVLDFGDFIVNALFTFVLFVGASIGLLFAISWIT